MEHLLLIYSDERWWASLPSGTRAGIVREYFALTDEMGDTGVYVSGGPLRSTGRSSIVRIRGDELLVSDGPLIERKEQLDGYFLLDVESMDEARAWAAKVPAARWGRVEVRPLVQIETRASAA